MKRCPKCSRTYPDDTLYFCLDDGESLIPDGESSEARTAIQLPHPSSEKVPRSTDQTAVLPPRDIKENERSLLSGRILLPVAVIVFLGLGGYLTYRYFYSERNAPITSVAVLPFSNRSGDAETQYLSEGLAESLIYRLSTLPGLSVSPTSTVFRYEDKDIDPVAIGNELGVRAIVSGRIVQHGDDITISTELVDVRSRKVLWGEQYDRKMSELLGTQREIAQEIADNLKLKIAPEDKSLTKNYTQSNEAYQLYLKGRFYWNKRTVEGVKTAIGYFEQSIQQDPAFALAYVGLSDCYNVPINPDPPDEKMPKAKAAALRALQLDDSLAEAHTSLARVLIEYDWNWTQAEKEFQRSIELNPRYATAHQWYGGLLETMGRHNDSIVERKKALELDPLSLIINFELGLGYFYSRDYDNAIEQFNRTLELQPDIPPVTQFLPFCFQYKGLNDEAESQFRSGVQKAGPYSAIAVANLAQFYAATGRQAQARQMLFGLEQKASTTYVPADSIAMIYTSLGDRDKAFEWLDKAYNEHAFKMAWLKVEPWWDPLHSDPRFDALVKKIGIP